GSKVGEGHGLARVVGATGDTDQVLQTGFTTTAMSAAASGIRAVSGGGQSGRAGTTLPDRLVVEVSDAFGNPKSDVAIAWTVTGGGGVSAANTTTGPDGQASVERTLGTSAGPQTTRASSAGLAGSPVTFTH